MMVPVLSPMLLFIPRKPREGLFSYFTTEARRMTTMTIVINTEKPYFRHYAMKSPNNVSGLSSDFHISANELTSQDTE